MRTCHFPKLTMAEVKRALRLDGNLSMAHSANRLKYAIRTIDECRNMGQINVRQHSSLSDWAFIRFEQ